MGDLISKDDRDVVTGDDWMKKDFYEYRKSQSHKKNKLLIWVVVIAIMSVISLKCHATEWECSCGNTAQSLSSIYYDSAVVNVECVRRKVKKRYSEDSNQYILFLRQYNFFKSSIASPKNRVVAAVKLRNDCISLFYSYDNGFFNEIDVYLLKAIEDFGVSEKYER